MRRRTRSAVPTADVATTYTHAVIAHADSARPKHQMSSTTTNPPLAAGKPIANAGGTAGLPYAGSDANAGSTTGRSAGPLNRRGTIAASTATSKASAMAHVPIGARFV